MYTKCAEWIWQAGWSGSECRPGFPGSGCIRDGLGGWLKQAHTGGPEVFPLRCHLRVMPGGEQGALCWGHLGGVDGVRAGAGGGCI